MIIYYLLHIKTYLLLFFNYHNYYYLLLLLFSYLFNVGESTQRLFMEMKIKLKTFNKIFLNKIDESATSGLPGNHFLLKINKKKILVTKFIFIRNYFRSF